MIAANAFLELAERQIAAPRKVLASAAEKRARTRALAERDKQFAQWRTWRQERCAALLEGPHADAARSLLAQLNQLTMADSEHLINCVRSGPWVTADATVRQTLLAIIDNTIIELRERNGLPPFDDPLPGEPPNAFLTLRELLG
jgi:hypothetical protein